MQLKTNIGMRGLILASAIMCLFSIAGVGTTLSAQTYDNASAQESNTITRWHEAIRNISPPTTGCFHAEYPNLKWEQETCRPTPTYRSRIRCKVSAVPHAEAIRPETTGNGTDYSIQTPTLTASAIGSFPSVKGVKSEQGVNVSFGGGTSNGITGPNEYTLQLNTDFTASSPVCSSYGYSSCYSWEQFIYSTNADGISPADPEAFIQNWIFPDYTDYSNYGCPNGWYDAQSYFQVNGAEYASCVVNSSAVSVAGVAATSLGNLKLTAAAKKGGNDTVTFTNGTSAKSISEPDSTLDLAYWWRISEFNIVGNAGGSQAKFNSGSSLTVKVSVSDGSTTTPSCIGPSNGGTTGETNNLNLGSCTAVGGSAPYIQFTESN